MPFNGAAFGLPFTMNSVEGTEASLFVAASAAKAGWRKSLIALGAAVVTLVPIGFLIWVLFRYTSAKYLDYAIAFLVFALGVREIIEGLGERPAKRVPADSGQTERTGLAPASTGSIRAFQRGHGLEPTGVIDDGTRAAIRAARSEAGQDTVDPYVFGVDPADTAMVRAFQQRHGLPVTGDVDAMTAGALRVAQQQGLPDGLDPDAIRRFQADHGLPETGDVDDETAVAIATVRGEGATRAGEDGQTVAPDTAYRDLDPADSDSIRRFQRSLGLAPDGSIGAETRGALLAVRARLCPDPARPSGDTPPSNASPDGLAPDPANAESVRAFQRRFGLEPDGDVGPGTQQALRYTHDFLCDVDPLDEESIRRFQDEHGLAATGIIDHDTQASLAAVRAERFPADSKVRKARYGVIVADDGPGPRLNLDVTDAEAIGAFQKAHGLAPDGVVGPRTREALAVALAERADGGPLIGAHGRPAGPSGPLGMVRKATGEAWPAYVGVILETSEAVLYSFAVASTKFALMPAIIGAGVGYAWPWSILPLIRKATARVAEWKQETVIGLILVSVATAFGLLHMVGVFG